MIKEFIIYLFAILVTIPIVATWLVYMAARKVGKSNLKAVHITVRITTILYIVAVEILFLVILGQSAAGYILVVILSILCAIIFYQWRYKTEIIFLKAVKVTWRASFLLFVFVYLFLIIVGIIQRIFF